MLNKNVSQRLYTTSRLLLLLLFFLYHSTFETCHEHERSSGGRLGSRLIATLSFFQRSIFHTNRFPSTKSQSMSRTNGTFFSSPVACHSEFSWNQKSCMISHNSMIRTCCATASGRNIIQQVHPGSLFIWRSYASYCASLSLAPFSGLSAACRTKIPISVWLIVPSVG